MKKFCKICFPVFLLLAFAFTACGSQGQAAAGGSGQTGTAPEFTGNSPDLYGEVKAISGTEVTLALIELPRQRFNREQGGDRPEGNNAGGNAGNNGENRFNRGNGDGASPGANPDGGSDGTNMPRRNNGQRSMPDIQRSYTGETVTLNIPAGTPISTFERGDGAMTEKKLTLGDIKAGALLQVWYKKEPAGSKEIESIRLTQAPASSNTDAAQ
jgi:hypothetical protein